MLGFRLARFLQTPELPTNPNQMLLPFLVAAKVFGELLENPMTGKASTLEPRSAQALRSRRLMMLAFLGRSHPSSALEGRSNKRFLHMLSTYCQHTVNILSRRSIPTTSPVPVQQQIQASSAFKLAMSGSQVGGRRASASWHECNHTIRPAPMLAIADFLCNSREETPAATGTGSSKKTLSRKIYEQSRATVHVTMDALVAWT